MPHEPSGRHTCPSAWAQLLKAFFCQELTERRMAQTNTQRSSHLSVIEKQWAAQSLLDDRVFEKTQFCWHSLETLNKPVYKEATVTQNFR